MNGGDYGKRFARVLDHIERHLDEDLFHYLNLASEVPEHELTTDLYLPLERANPS